MGLTAGQSSRGSLASLRVTDADGRQYVVASGGVADSVPKAASVAAPGAAATLASVAVVAGAVYEVEARITLTGTAETAPINVELRVGSTQLSLLPTLSGAGQQSFRLPRVTTGVATTIDLRSVAAAVAGSVYTVVLVATRVE